MGTNYHTAFSNVAPKTPFTKAAMGAPLSDLDRAITYLKYLVGCNGDISWDGSKLKWTGSILIYFTGSNGIMYYNEIEASEIALSDTQYAYATLVETNAQKITVSAANIGATGASTTMTYNRFVLGYRNAVDDEFYPSGLVGVMAGIKNPLSLKGAIDASTNPNYPAANAGHIYRFSVGGKIGGASGPVVQAGEIMICNTDNTAAGDHATVGAYWNIGQVNIDLAAPGTIGDTTPGVMYGKMKEIYITASGSLTALQCSKTLVSNYGMTDADCIVQLPAAAEGLSFICILPTVRDRVFSFQAAAGDKIYLLGIAGEDNGLVGVGEDSGGYETGTSCQFFTFKASDGGFDWFCIPIFGDWHELAGE